MAVERACIRPSRVGGGRDRGGAVARGLPDLLGQVRLLRGEFGGPPLLLGDLGAEPPPFGLEVGGEARAFAGLGVGGPGPVTRGLLREPGPLLVELLGLAGPFLQQPPGVLAHGVEAAARQLRGPYGAGGDRDGHTEQHGGRPGDPGDRHPGGVRRGRHRTDHRERRQGGGEQGCGRCGAEGGSFAGGAGRGHESCPRSVSSVVSWARGDT
ncbi:hypothetical protein ACFQ51_18960 [Streptomyces kaempferi]